ncbi:MAG: alpha/beta hydrolase [Planctomycetota bacterium]
MTGLVVALVVVEVALPLLMVAVKDRMMFFPMKEPPPSTALDVPWVKDWIELVRVERPDGRRLAAYDAVPPGWNAETGPCVLFFHGNAGNIAGRVGTLQAFARESGARIIMPDYSGYGGNEGSPSEKEVVMDGLATWDHAEALGIPPDRIILFGESLGGAVALAVAEQRDCAGVAVQSTFSSLSSMAMSLYPWMPLASLLVKGSFPSSKRAAALKVPLLVVHGDEDSIIPPSQGRKLHEAATEPKEFLAIPGAGHNDLFMVAGDEYLRSLGERFSRWTKSRD